MPKKKATNSQNLHRESQLRVETNIQGVIHDDPTEVNKIFYKMNSQSDYDPKLDMQHLGLAGNPQSRERLRTKKRQTQPAKPAHRSGVTPPPKTKEASKKPAKAKAYKETDDAGLEKAIKKDLSNKGIY